MPHQHHPHVAPCLSGRPRFFLYQRRRCCQPHLWGVRWCPKIQTKGSSRHLGQIFRIVSRRRQTAHGMAQKKGRHLSRPFKRPKRPHRGVGRTWVHHEPGRGGVQGSVAVVFGRSGQSNAKPFLRVRGPPKRWRDVDGKQPMRGGQDIFVASGSRECATSVARVAKPLRAVRKLMHGAFQIERLDQCGTVRRKGRCI